jgi:hypothetical protein
MILQNPPKSPFKKGGLYIDSKEFLPFVKGHPPFIQPFVKGKDLPFPPFVKGGARGDFYKNGRDAAWPYLIPESKNNNDSKFDIYIYW